MACDAQIRANALLSTGPKTEECKACVSRNDLVAGAYIRDSQRGNTLNKLARDQVTLERSYYRARCELERRAPHPEIGFED